jgi:hypothetical protein
MEKNTSVRHRETKLSNMKRFHGEMERNLFAAETVCGVDNYKWDSKTCEGCPFTFDIMTRDSTCFRCAVPRLRALIGIGANL